MKKKILMVNSCLGLYGGVESFLLNIFRYLDKDEFSVTLLTCGISTYDMFRDEIIASGGKIDIIPIYPNTLKKQMRLYQELRRYYEFEKPDIVHINSGGLSFHLIAGKAARTAGISHIILHSHNFVPGENSAKRTIKRILKKSIPKLGNTYLACSTGAAKWIFPEKLVDRGLVEIIPNGIDTRKFAYDKNKRNSFRTELGLDKELVIGNIGRFQPQKNHRFVIRILKEVVKILPDAKLLLAGKGELQSEIEQYVDSLKLRENIIFLGERKDMECLLSAIDIFILPSLHEGLPIAAIEAQAAGAVVILANTISTETNVTGKALYLPIQDNQDEKLWAKKICESYEYDRCVYAKEVANAGYDIENYCNRMEHIYREV
jgi:glycosyltransferase EpsF